MRSLAFGLAALPDLIPGVPIVTDQGGPVAFGTGTQYFESGCVRAPDRGEFFDRALVDCVEQKDMLCRAGRGIGEDFADHVLRFRVIAQGYERLLDGRRFFRRKL